MIWPCIILGVMMPRTVPWQVLMFLPLVSFIVMVWAAIEGMHMQRALREPPGVWIATFFGGLIPPVALVLAVVMLIESVAVLKIARRLRRDQCAMCGYDLRGIEGAICPECGWKMGSEL